MANREITYVCTVSARHDCNVVFTACGRQTGDRVVLAVPDRTNAHVTLAAEGTRVAAVWGAGGGSGDGRRVRAQR